MSRFEVVPTERKPAMEQLFDAAERAALHILKTHRFYGLVGSDRRYLIDECVLNGVRHFMRYKVGERRYDRRFCFMSNVMSSVWSVQGNTADRLLKRIIARKNTADLSAVEFSIGEGDGLPLYVGASEAARRCRKRAPFDRMRTQDRARIVRGLYDDYLVEARELGLSNVLDFRDWMRRNGYWEDTELVLSMGDRDRYREYLENKRKAEKEELKHLEWCRENGPPRGLNQVFGEPPRGYEWVERGHVGCLRKIRRIS